MEYRPKNYNNRFHKWHLYIQRAQQKHHSSHCVATFSVSAEKRTTSPGNSRAGVGGGKKVLTSSNTHRGRHMTHEKEPRSLQNAAQYTLVTGRERNTRKQTKTRKTQANTKSQAAQYTIVITGWGERKQNDGRPKIQYQKDSWRLQYKSQLQPYSN